MASQQDEGHEGSTDEVAQAVQSPWDTVDAVEARAASPLQAGAGKPLIAQVVEGEGPPLVRDAASGDLPTLPAARDVAEQPAPAFKPVTDPFLTLPLRTATNHQLAAEADADADDDGTDDHTPLRIGPAPVETRGGGWTLVALCAGIAVIACCLIIPQTDANRRLAWEREKLKLDLEAVRKQVAVNTEFLQKLPDDPTLAERLAQRQMRMVRQGSSVLRLKHDLTNAEMNPFLLTAVAAPEPMSPYQAPRGLLSDLFLVGKSRLYATGTGLLLVAAGLVLGYAPKRE